jgi:hypothetical protein
MIDINLREIQNGKTEVENAKLVLSILMMQAISTDKDLKIQLQYVPEEIRERQ